MKQLIRIATLIPIWFFCSELAMTATAQVREIDSISGRSLMAIQTSLPELAKRGLDFTKYKIVIYAFERSIVVSFKDPGARQTQFGNLPGQLPGFEVVLSEDGMTVLRFQFVK
jgi:hypothetical protein